MDLQERWKRPEPAVLLTIMGRAMNWMPSLPVVGGCSVGGGVGAVPGVAIGVTVFTVIQYGMTFVGINPYWQNVVKGAIIVIAVAIDVRKYAKKR